MSIYQVILLAVIHATPLSYSESGRSELSILNQCTCIGFNQTYKCTVVAERGATIWRGTAINCPEIGNEIFLHHSLTEKRSCTSRAITAHGIRNTDSCYTSQLSIMITDLAMDNESVQCMYSNGTSTLVGLAYIEITKDPFPPPNDTTINGIMEDMDRNMILIFTWSPVVLNCLSLHYVITSNCGSCPNTTVMTTITCRGVLVGEQCTFTLRSGVCSSIVGNASTISVDLKVPDAPVISVVPTYSLTTGSLFAITTIFNELEKFNITYGLDGSAVNYTVVYSDTVSEMICYSTTLPASTCGHYGICRHVQNFPLSNCHNPVGIRVSVYGTNVLRSGSSSNFTVGVKNTFIKVTFEENFATATCKFLQWQPSSDKRYQSNCSIVYGYKLRFPVGSESIMGLSLNDTVIFNLSIHEIPSKQEYQFIVTATNGTFTAQVMGTFITGASSSFVVGGLAFGISIGVLILIILLITVILVTVLAIFIRSKKNTATTAQAHQSDSFNISKDSSSHIDTKRNLAYEPVHFRTISAT